MQDTTATVTLLTRHSDSLLSTYHVTATAGFRRCIDVWEELKWLEIAWEMPIAPSRTENKKSQYFLAHWYSYNLYQVSSRLSPPFPRLAGFLEAIIHLSICVPVMGSWMLSNVIGLALPCHFCFALIVLMSEWSCLLESGSLKTKCPSNSTKHDARMDMSLISTDKRRSTEVSFGFFKCCQFNAAFRISTAVRTPKM